MFKYIYKLRPPAPGCQPKRNLIKTVDFDNKKVYQGVNGWGYAIYSEELENPSEWDLELVEIMR
jgi:hypothetical protein